jgi:hypothetical protein
MLGLTQNQLIGKTSFDPLWHNSRNGTYFTLKTIPTALGHFETVNKLLWNCEPTKNDVVWLLVDAIPVFGENK